MYSIICIRSSHHIGKEITFRCYFKKLPSVVAKTAMIELGLYSAARGKQTIPTILPRVDDAPFLSLPTWTHYGQKDRCYCWLLQHSVIIYSAVLFSLLKMIASCSNETQEVIVELPIVYYRKTIDKRRHLQ